MLTVRFKKYLQKDYAYLYTSKLTQLKTRDYDNRSLYNRLPWTR